MSHTWMRHVTHMNEACHAHEWGMSRTWMRHVTHMNEACHAHEWGMSHTWMRHVTHMNDARICINTHTSPRGHDERCQNGCRIFWACMYDMTRSYVWHTRDMTRSYIWHDPFTCVTWRIHMWFWRLVSLYVWHEGLMSYMCHTHERVMYTYRLRRCHSNMEIRHVAHMKESWQCRLLSLYV